MLTLATCVLVVLWWNSSTQTESAPFDVVLPLPIPPADALPLIRGGRVRSITLMGAHDSWSVAALELDDGSTLYSKPVGVLLELLEECRESCEAIPVRHLP